MKHPVFSYGIQDDFLVIEDMYTEDYPTQSVTNGIERVLSLIQANTGPLPRKVIYRDTEGLWDGVLHTEGEFLRFMPLRVKTLEEAKRRYDGEATQVGSTMPFTDHEADSLFNTLDSIAKCPLPTEVFDAFLWHYGKHKDLEAARFFAFTEWDC